MPDHPAPAALSAVPRGMVGHASVTRRPPAPERNPSMMRTSPSTAAGAVPGAVSRLPDAPVSPAVRVASSSACSSVNSRTAGPRRRHRRPSRPGPGAGQQAGAGAYAGCTGSGSARRLPSGGWQPQTAPRTKLGTRRTHPGRNGERAPLGAAVGGRTDRDAARLPHPPVLSSLRPSGDCQSATTTVKLWEPSASYRSESGSPPTCSSRLWAMLVLTRRGSRVSPAGGAVGAVGAVGS